jgi:outer membrane lipoprotein SlyB
MKKFLVVLLILATFALCVPDISAQARRHRRRSFWRKHRDKITVAGTSVAGAAVGGIVGGKKGAAIGAGAGAGGGALYTYKLRRRHRRRPR